MLDESSRMLCDYETGDELRPASDDEIVESFLAAVKDGGRGVILVDGDGLVVAELDGEIRKVFVR